MKKYKKIASGVSLSILILLGMSSCKQETKEKGVTESSSTIASSTQTTQDSIQTYIVTVDEDASTEQILVTMNPTVEQNKNNSALGETTFNGYLLIDLVSIRNEAGDVIKATDIKKGDQLKLSVKEPVIMARSFPPKIAGDSIETIILMD